MKYLKSFNESEDIKNILEPIRSEIEDRLIEFRFGYDIKLLFNSSEDKNFQLYIVPKDLIWFNTGVNTTEPLLIDNDILNDFKGVIEYIKKEIGFNYTHSYYFMDHKYDKIYNDIFTSLGKSVTMIQMFFNN